MTASCQIKAQASAGLHQPARKRVAHTTRQRACMHQTANSVDVRTSASSPNWMALSMHCSTSAMLSSSDTSRGTKLTKLYVSSCVPNGRMSWVFEETS